MEVNKYAKQCLDKATMVFVRVMSSIERHNKSYDYEKNNKSRPKPKTLYKMQESVEAI